jgi:parallel beta-helix repeat protein
VLALFLSGAAACGSDSGKPQGCTTVLPLHPDPAANHDTIQTALANAQMGQVLCFEAGVYPLHDELTLTTAGVELRGSTAGTGTVLDFDGQTSGANGLSVQADHFTLSRITLSNTAGDAVRVNKSDTVTFTDVTVTWRSPATSNGAYGLYPVECHHVLIDHCKVSGASDAGIYVGQSDHVIVRNSEALSNVAGIEIENTTDAEVVGNYAHDNAGGILVFNLPNLPVKDGKRAKVHQNQITSNNQPNFAAAGSIVSTVPTGSGMLLLSSDFNEIHDNTIADNESVGLAVVSYLLLQRNDYMTDPAYDLYPQGNFIHDNQAQHNGYDPQGIALVLASLASISTIEDLIWDGIADDTRTDPSLRNCFQNNSATFRYLDAANNFQGTSTDIAPYTCVGMTLPALSW